MRRLVQPALALTCAFAIASAMIAVSGGNPFQAFAAVFACAFGSGPAVGETLVKAVPLLLSGLAVAIGLRTGLFNIGVEGQLVMGGLAAAWVGCSVQLPAVLHVPLCLAAAGLVGGLWALLPGLLKAKRGVHEVISTIMLNYTAFYLVHYLVTNPFKGPNTMSPQTPPMAPTALLAGMPEAGGIHLGILVAALCAAGFAFLMSRSVIGFEMKTVGLGPEAARASGINVTAVLVLAMLLSGAVAGLAGAVEVMGVHHKFYDHFSPGYGFDSIAVALLGGSAAIGTSLSALLFGALRSGAVGMQLATDTPKEIVVLIQAVVIVFAGMKLFSARSQK